MTSSLWAPGPTIMRIFAAIILVALATSDAFTQATSPLEVRANAEIRAALFPQADRFELSGGGLPFLRAFAGDEQLGYVFSTFDIVRARSYSPTNGLGSFSTRILEDRLRPRTRRRSLPILFRGRRFQPGICERASWTQGELYCGPMIRGHR